MVDAGCADDIAGLLGCSDEGGGGYDACGVADGGCAVASFCVRDMRSYTFWALWSYYIM